MNVRQPRIGVIPLYLAVYDEIAPQNHTEAANFARSVAETLRGRNLEVLLSGVCRVKPEIDLAVRDQIASGVDLLMTLHLTYAPSLEAVEALMETRVPLVLLDTTPHPRFADRATEEELLKNHGIYGVQDLASVLRRRGRPYRVITGHLNEDDVLREVDEVARAARAAQALTSMQVLALGTPAAGVGDFLVSPEELQAGLGVRTVAMDLPELADYVGQVNAGDVLAENDLDLESYACAGLRPEALTDSNRLGLAVRAVLRERGLQAFTANFNDFDPVLGLHSYPFLEACKAMARGVGYAGEGDVLTAALVGALLQALGEVTVCTMFCPDWAEHWLLMNYMGECNLTLAAEQPRLVDRRFPLGQLQNAVVPIFPVPAGAATLINLAPGPDGSFALIAGRVRVLTRELELGPPNSPHFWIRPEGLSLREFLGRFSELGGTHHSALAYGEQAGVAKAMAQMLGINFHRIAPSPEM
jgi:L-arabinose isomerase